MRASELIDELKKLPPETEVKLVVLHPGGPTVSSLESVTHVAYDKDSREAVIETDD